MGAVGDFLDIGDGHPTFFFGNPWVYKTPNMGLMTIPYYTETMGSLDPEIWAGSRVPSFHDALIIERSI